MDCVFCKIIKGEIPSSKVYEDEKMIIIKDINPQTPIHLLMIPKEHFKGVAEMSAKQSVILGEMFKRLGELERELGLKDGYRIIVNKGENGCQTVPHLHVHILGGKKLNEQMV